jgi:hypothetical protein
LRQLQEESEVIEEDSDVETTETTDVETTETTDVETPAVELS